MSKHKNIFRIIRNMGLRYTLYRALHEVERRAGVLRRRHPLNPEQKYFISLEKWRKHTPVFVIADRDSLNIEKRKNIELLEYVERVKGGEIRFFSRDWIKLGHGYDWITNPDNGYRYDINKHWSEIPDLSKESGDIKYVWEKSRFTFILPIIRNDYHNEQDNAEFVFSEIEKWIDANPVNQGPNWRCSQEISLRILNWCFAIHFYKNSEALTEIRWKKIQHIIYWSLHHVYHHINFSRIAVRNNHAITETLFLTLSRILFPYIPEVEKWAKKGKKWFEEEIDYQIYEDGTYLQFSMNYHRVVIQLLSLGIAIYEINGKKFSSIVYDKAYKSLNFLYQNLQTENGYLPNYGANDGAWFFPLSDSDYRDYRSQLNALHLILTGKKLFGDNEFVEEFLWLGGITTSKIFRKLELQTGISEFPVGGYYLIREPKMFTFIKCGSYKDRPSHADNLHIDVWYNGENMLFDAGSYKYNTDEKTALYFLGTQSHNTLTLDDFDQMLKGTRFIWTHWSQADSARITENAEDYNFDGTITAFSYLGNNIKHRRCIIKKKGKPVWIVKDEVINKPQELKLKQLWHFDNNRIKFESTILGNKKEGERSLYYGQKQQAEQLSFSTKENILETIIWIE